MLVLKKSPLIIAHRGGKFWEESNFSYILESVRDGADIIELDVLFKNGEYVVQHAPWGKPQGKLFEALEKAGSVSLYLHIKSPRMDVNELIDYVHSICSNEIIIGSSNLKLLRSIKDYSVIKNCHCLLPLRMLAKGRAANADWVSPVCYFVTSRLAQKIQVSGFKFVPSGNLIFKKKEVMRNQLRYGQCGAHAISTHHVKEMKEILVA